MTMTIFIFVVVSSNNVLLYLLMYLKYVYSIYIYIYINNIFWNLDRYPTNTQHNIKFITTVTLPHGIKKLCYSILIITLMNIFNEGRLCIRS